MIQVAIAAVGIALALVVVAHALFSHTPGVLPENVARIQPGMSLGQVEAILGGPPRSLVWQADEQGGTAGGQGVWYAKRPERRGGYHRVHVGPTITVHFDANRKATKASYAN
jgi:hypothetical protein